VRIFPVGIALRAFYFNYSRYKNFSKSALYQFGIKLPDPSHRLFSLFLSFISQINPPKKTLKQNQLMPAKPSNHHPQASDHHELSTFLINAVFIHCGVLRSWLGVKNITEFYL